MVSDISVADTKLKVTYSDNTTKNMDLPPATSLRLPWIGSAGGVNYIDFTGMSPGFSNQGNLFRLKGKFSNGTTISFDLYSYNP